jgi:tRNA nucleotidyltransferase (CCA-adding enzyme)
METYLVGGAVRDDLLGLVSQDLDFTVVAQGGWEEMRNTLLERGFEIFLETPQYLTIRARFPKSYAATGFYGRDVKGLTADFVLARKEGEYTDGRHPDKVVPGTLLDDISRRDFTVNALAKDAEGNLIDLFGGVQDLQDGVLRAVGNAEARLREDALRALRALRFTVTKDLRPNDELMSALRSDWLPLLLASVSVERRRGELFKAFKFSTPTTLDLIHEMTPAFRDAIFDGNLWLMPTLKQ